MGLYMVLEQNDFNFIRNSIRQALLEGIIVRNGNGEEIKITLILLMQQESNS